MTPREQFIKALKREKIEGHVPTFELVFFLTMESIGRVHPLHRFYGQWNQMSRAEKKLQLKDMALAYIEIAEKYHHNAIFVHPNPGPDGEMPDNLEDAREILETIRELSGDKVCLIGNVNCGKMQTGTMEELEEDVRRSLRQGMPGYGYIFSTSNCAYTGLGLDRYERMNQIWWEEGVYR